MSDYDLESLSSGDFELFLPALVADLEPEEFLVLLALVDFFFGLVFAVDPEADVRELVFLVVLLVFEVDFELEFFCLSVELRSLIFDLRSALCTSEKSASPILSACVTSPLPVAL